MSLQGRIGELEYLRESRNYRVRLLNRWHKELNDSSLTFWEAYDRIREARAAQTLPAERRTHRAD